jgi:soluble lytic murein transglycosylase
MALARSDSATAHLHLLDALREGDAYAGGRDAARLLDRMSWALTPEVDRIVGRALVAAGSWEPAYLRLRPWLDSNQLSAGERDELRAFAGRSLVELRRFREAEVLLAPLLRDGDSTYPVLSGLFWSGRSALAREDISLAESHFRALARRAPSSPLAEEAFSLLLTREMESGFGPRSLGYLDELLQVDIRVPEIETLVVRLGSTLYLRGEYSAAARTFDRLGERSLRTSARQQAAYWAGLSLDRGGDRGAARDRWRSAHEAEPFSFYGVLSAERIDAPLLSLDLRFGPAIARGSDVELRNALLRLRVHRLVPTVGSFNYELERLTKHFASVENGGYGFAEGLIAGGFPLQGVVLGRELVQAEGGWNLRLLRIVHPFPHREIIVREANARGLSPFFVAGVIRQESLFQPAVQSSSGAMGLMQLMPTTAREVAGTLGVTYSAQALVDPETNVRFGTTYLATMLRRFDGRPEDALAAYNAGPTRARQWRDLPEYVDSAVFTEHIPFQETRSYVKLVQQYARVYAALYGCGDFEPCLGLSPSRIAALASLPEEFRRVDTQGEM